jgi:hypothetical protein
MSGYHDDASAHSPHGLIIGRVRAGRALRSDVDHQEDIYTAALWPGVTWSSRKEVFLTGSWLVE